MSTAPGNPANPPAAGPCTAATHFTAPALPSKETPAMTTTLTADPARTAAAAILRAVADLIETRPDIPEPGSSVSFYLYGPDAPAAMAAIAAALPCEWQASIRRSGEHEWLNLDSNAPVTSVTRGARVQHQRPRRRRLHRVRGQDGHRLAARRRPDRAGRPRAARGGGLNEQGAPDRPGIGRAVPALAGRRARRPDRRRSHRQRARPGGRHRGRRHGDRRRGGPDRVPDPGRASHARGLAGTEGGHPMTAAPAAMTKTEALAIARQARRYGHRADAGPDDPRAVSVACPRCTQRVHAVREPRRASRGPLYESPGRALDRAMLAHLTEGWCEP